MYRTEATWKRASKKEIENTVKVLQERPVVFECTCNRCPCGGTQTSTLIRPKFEKTRYGRNQKGYYEMEKIPYCRKCGRVKRDKKGREYGLGHSELCKPEEGVSSYLFQVKAGENNKGRYFEFRLADKSVNEAVEAGYAPELFRKYLRK